MNTSSTLLYFTPHMIQLRNDLLILQSFVFIYENNSIFKESNTLSSLINNICYFLKHYS